jgi:mRNA interferase RelE/StbE
MAYEVLILRGAQKELADLPEKPYMRVCNAIRRLSENPRPTGCTKLAGREGWRIRVGDYRLIFEIDDKKKSVTILHIGLRRDIYRRK